MESYLEIVVIVSLLAAFIVLLVKKWGWAEWMQVHGDKFLSQLFSCDLCMSFWAAVVVSVAVVMLKDNAVYMTLPFFTTPITRMIV